MDVTMSIVDTLSPDLSGKQRRHLRGLAHDLKPIVWVGQNGISDGLIDNLEAALIAHELVKVKVHDKDDIESAAKALHEATGAQLAQVIGKMLVFYREHPEKPAIKLPA
jgi:RNA-binding protein